MLPFNIASYALLAQIIGKMTNMVPKGIIGNFSNVHIYEPHLNAVKEQLSRDVDKYGKCDLSIMDHIPSLIDNYNKGNKPAISSKDNSLDSLLDCFRIKDFNLSNYKSYPRIPAEMLAYNK